jgi:hypothetical protein
MRIVSEIIEEELNYEQAVRKIRLSLLVVIFSQRSLMTSETRFVRACIHLLSSHATYGQLISAYLPDETIQISSSLKLTLSI